MNIDLDVARLRGLGFDVFPCNDMKRPRVRWQDDPPPGGWPFREGDLIGVRLPAGTVVLDVDNLERFRASGLEVVQSVYSGTRRDDGLHIYYRTDGRTPPQVTEGGELGYDTRVGGLGYVIAWTPERWRSVSEWAYAPEWMYTEPKGPRSEERDPLAPMGTRGDILSWLGKLALTGSLTAADYYAMLSERLANGTIVNLDPRRPWTDADMHKLAAEAAKWEPADTELVLRIGTTIEPEDLAGMDSADLIGLDLPPLEWRIENLMPEGLGLIAAPPKSGKSVFAYQIAVELALGGAVLGIPVPKGPVLYYALEDGRRRSQTRVLSMLKGRALPRGYFSLKWTAPPLGGGLEAEIHEWLSNHESALVIIDVLAKVRPIGSSRKTTMNAYDADYEALNGLQQVAKLHPGCTILVVTHDRKAGSDDWMTRVTGTRGVTGSADFVIYINRDRGKDIGSIVVAGRDVEDGVFPAQFDVTGWLPADPLNFTRSAMSDTRLLISQWVEEHGPAWPKDISEGTGLDAGVVRNRVRDMEESGDLVSLPDRLGYRVPGTFDDLTA